MLGRLRPFLLPNSYREGFFLLLYVNGEKRYGNPQSGPNTPLSLRSHINGNVLNPSSSVPPSLTSRHLRETKGTQSIGPVEAIVSGILDQVTHEGRDRESPTRRSLSHLP